MSLHGLVMGMSWGQMPRQCHPPKARSKIFHLHPAAVAMITTRDDIDGYNVDGYHVHMTSNISRHLKIKKSKHRTDVTSHDL